MHQKPPQNSVKPREAQEERGFRVLAGSWGAAWGEGEAWSCAGAAGGTWSWIWDHESKSHDSVARPLVLLSSCLKGCQESGLTDSARTELGLFGLFRYYRKQHGVETNTVCLTGKLWHGKTSLAALSPGRCYPKDLVVLKVMINLSYWSTRKKLQKGHARNRYCSSVHLNCTFKKLASKRHHLKVNFVLLSAFLGTVLDFGHK